MPAASAQTGRGRDAAAGPRSGRCVRGRGCRAAAALGLVAPPSAAAVPATALADPAWTAELVAARARAPGRPTAGAGDRVVVLGVARCCSRPPLAGLVAGMPLSARLADTDAVRRCRGGGRSRRRRRPSGADLGAELRESLAAVIAAVAEAGGMRERPLWAIATDSLANRLLALGRALGDVPRVTALAAPLAAAVGPPLPVPRYVDVGRRAVHPAGVVLPGLPAAGRAAVHLVPAPSAGRAAPPCSRAHAPDADPAQGRKSIESPNSCQR